MIKTLAKNNFHFPGAPNRVRCIAHIVNLVTKIILRQFDVKKKAREAKKIPENANDDSDSNFNNSFEVVDNDDNVDDLASLAEGLDREEQEMADDEDDDMRGDVAVEVEEIEEGLKEEVLEVAKKVKPIQRVLFKVR
jgi:hypothetical protein